MAKAGLFRGMRGAVAIVDPEMPTQTDPSDPTEVEDAEPDAQRDIQEGDEPGPERDEPAESEERAEPVPEPSNRSPKEPARAEGKGTAKGVRPVRKVAETVAYVANRRRG